MTKTPREVAELQYLERISDLLDTRFRIPGTNIRFGLDFLVGLIPFGGDLLTFLFSGLLVIAMTRHGASGMVVARMLWNVLLDTTVGAIPFFGDLFDLGFKANQRNYQLLKDHYTEGKHQGNAWPVIIGVIVVLLLMLLFLIFAMVEFAKWLF